MKRSPLGSLLWLSLICTAAPLALLAVARFRAAEDARRIAYYSRPFAPQLKLERGVVPKTNLPNFFEIRANCRGFDGSGKSVWYLRGALFRVAGNRSVKVWATGIAARSYPLDEEKVDLISEMNSGYCGSLGSTYPGPSPETYFNWRFNNPAGSAGHFKFIAEAIAVPSPRAEGQAGTRTFSGHVEDIGLQGMEVTYVTGPQFEKAKRQPGARYLKDEINLPMKDNVKHFFVS